MKKKLLFICLFVLLIIPFRVNAAYLYEAGRVDVDNMINAGWLSTWPDADTQYKVGSNPESGAHAKSYFWFHGVYGSSNKYAVLCSNIGKLAGIPETEGIDLSVITNLDSLHTAGGASLTAQKKNLLKEVLVNGYHYDLTNTNSISNIGNSREATLSMYAMQIIVWEIVEGGRTSFDTVAPSYNPSNSAYNLLIYPNGGSSNATNTLYYYYKKIINDTKEAITPSNATAFNTDTYKMTWNPSTNKYSVNVTGLGKYTTCTSNNSNVTVTSTSNGVTLSSSNVISTAATISCSYTVGTGTGSEYFYYFKFANTGNCSSEGDCQDLIYGAGRKTYTKSFKVKSENASIKIKKYGINKNEISGATFSLTHTTTTNYSVNISANSSAATSINKSGQYIVSETNVPVGYERISDFNITINATTGRVTNCSNKSTNSSGNTTCVNGQVEVTYESGVIVLKIVDAAKNFKILKVDENDNPVKGATFEIYNASNQKMKFTLYTGNIFGYNASGTLTSIHLDNSSSYPIALLPEGEYTIVETSVPVPYRLSSDANQNKTKIKINSNRDMLVYDELQQTYVASVNASVKIKNYKTLVKIKKIGNGRNLPGVKFLLYNADRSKTIKSTMTSSGNYTYIENQNNAGNMEYITDANGYIVVRDLPVGTYYFREIQSIENFALPEGETAYTKVVIDVNKNGPTVNGSNVMDTVVISNTLASFNFYKIDEEGNYLTTGKFKLQKYDNDKNRYVDVKVVQVENDGTYSEKADIFKESEDGKVQFGLTNGIATFIEMQPSTTYRIVETVAPTGFVKQASNDTAIVSLDEFGNSSGLLVLTNQKVLKEEGEAKAELVVNIQTGQARVRYALIIATLVTAIFALVYVQRRRK